MVKKSTVNIFWPVCFSLAIHIALGAVVIVGLSGHLSFSATTDHRYETQNKLRGIIPSAARDCSTDQFRCAAQTELEFHNKLNLVWVSLETKNAGNPGAALQQRSESKPPVIERIVPQAANTAIAENKKEPIKATASADFTGSVREIKYTSIGPDTAKNNSSNRASGTALMTAGDSLSLGLAYAYPRYRENRPPVYPEIAKVRGYEGIVFVTAEILTDGNVGSLNIGKSSGYAVLDDAAIEAVKHWKFEPAQKMGKPFSSRVNLPIRFDIRDDNSQS